MEEHLKFINMHAVIDVCDALSQIVAQHLEGDLLKVYQNCNQRTEYHYNAKDMARRRLQNVCLQLLATLQNQDYYKLAFDQFSQATNMTEQVGAINALLHHECDERERVLSLFEKQWCNDNLVMDKWLSFHAASKIPTALQNVKHLMGHKVFTLRNPNKVRALIGAFAGQNTYAFHHPNGEGYEFVAQQVVKLDAINPQVASSLARSLMPWEKFAEPCRQKMHDQLEFIAKHKNLSKGVFEIVSKSLSTSD